MIMMRPGCERGWICSMPCWIQLCCRRRLSSPSVGKPESGARGCPALNQTKHYQGDGDKNNDSTYENRAGVPNGRLPMAGTLLGSVSLSLSVVEEPCSTSG